MSDAEVSKKAIVKELLERGKKNGMLSFKEIMDAFEVVDIGPDQIDKIYETIEKAGIEIVGDLDKELEEIEMSNEDVEDLSVPEGVNIDDHVKMYLKEIGKVPDVYKRQVYDGQGAPAVSQAFCQAWRAERVCGGDYNRPKNGQGL